MRVLIVGANGLIGESLARHYLASGCEIMQTSRRFRPRPFQQLDLASDDPVTVPVPQVDLAVFCAAITRFADCRNDADYARRVNVEGPIAFARRLAGSGTHCVLMSTSAVFDGSIPFVPPNTPVSPATTYGRLKVEAEHGFLDLGQNGSIVRLTKVLHPGHALFAGWVAALGSGESAEAVKDLRLAPIALSDVATGIRAAYRMGGIIQVSGARDVSYFDLLAHLARRLAAPPSRLRAVEAATLGILEEERPRHATLDTGTLTAETGWRPPDPDRLIDDLFLPTSRSQASNASIAQLPSL